MYFPEVSGSFGTSFKTTCRVIFSHIVPTFHKVNHEKVQVNSIVSGGGNTPVFV